jgi:urease accessory protein
MTRAMTVRWRVLQIADSGFPIGGFAHSSGLEAALHVGEVATADRLDGYLRAHLLNVGNGSLPFVAAAYDGPGDVWALDALLDAQLTNHVANRASRTQGRALLSTCARVFDEPLIAALAIRAASRDVAAHLAPVFGAALAALSVARHDALALHMLLALRGVASAAVRLGVVGPHEAQRLQSRHAATLDALIAECAEIGPGEAAMAAPLLEIYGAMHDQLYARLFQS